MRFFKHPFMFLCFSIFLIYPAQSAVAGAFDQLVEMSGGSVPNVPNVPEPTPVEPYDGGSNSGSSDSGSYQSGPSIFNWFSNPSQNTEAARQQRREAREAKKVQQAKSRERREKRRRKEKNAREDREWKEKQAQKPKWPAGLPKPRSQSYVPPLANPPSLKPPATAVPTGQEGKTLREYQFRIDVLRKKASLSDKEKALIASLEDACRKLWAKAASQPDLSENDRTKLSISLPVVGKLINGVQALVSKSQITGWKAKMTAGQEKGETPATPDDPISSFNTEKMQQLLEYQGGEFAENRLPENISSQYENLLGFGKVTMALKKGDMAEAVKEGMDMLVGRIGMPQASFAVEGGRIYSDVAFRSMDRFMVDSSKMLGVDFDTKEFWGQVQNNMTTAQKAVYKWIGGRDDK